MVRSALGFCPAVVAIARPDNVGHDHRVRRTGRRAQMGLTANESVVMRFRGRGGIADSC